MTPNAIIYQKMDEHEARDDKSQRTYAVFCKNSRIDFKKDEYGFHHVGFNNKIIIALQEMGAQVYVSDEVGDREDIMGVLDIIGIRWRQTGQGPSQVDTDTESVAEMRKRLGVPTDISERVFAVWRDTVETNEPSKKMEEFESYEELQDHLIESYQQASVNADGLLRHI